MVNFSIYFISSISRCTVYVADSTDDACLGEIDLDYNKYIAEGRLICICPKKLEAKDLKDNLMRNRRLFVFITGLEIFLQNMANNDILSITVAYKY